MEASAFHEFSEVTAESRLIHRELRRVGSWVFVGIAPPAQSQCRCTGISTLEPDCDYFDLEQPKPHTEWAQEAIK